jgi:NitT/TauT family transport system permease protein
MTDLGATGVARDAVPGQLADAAELFGEASSARERSARDRNLGLHAMQVLLLIALIGLWQLVGVTGAFGPVLSVPPLQVWDSLAHLASTGQLASATEYTMYAVLLGFVLAAVVGGVAGVAFGLLPRVERVLSPFIDGLNAAPRVVLAPVFIVAFGIGSASAVAMAFSLCVFIMFVNARAGVTAADPDVVRVAVALGASKWQVFRKIYTPCALPSIFAGLRLSLVFALFGVVASELIASSDGLGYIVQTDANSFDMAGVYGIVLVVMAIGVIINSLVRTAERGLLRWAPPEHVR